MVPETKGDICPVSMVTETLANTCPVSMVTEPGAGISALPPPRSAYMERRREEERIKKAASPRVKVFMPQQYNSPMGMYSAQNVMDTFQTQAEGLLQEMEE